jgi:hypothetical protein
MVQHWAISMQQNETCGLAVYAHQACADTNNTNIKYLLLQGGNEGSLLKTNTRRGGTMHMLQQSTHWRPVLQRPQSSCQ